MTRQAHPPTTGYVVPLMRESDAVGGSLRRAFGDRPMAEDMDRLVRQLYSLPDTKRSH